MFISHTPQPLTTAQNCRVGKRIAAIFTLTMASKNVFDLGSINAFNQCNMWAFDFMMCYLSWESRYSDPPGNLEVMRISHIGPDWDIEETFVLWNLPIGCDNRLVTEGHLRLDCAPIALPDGSIR